MYTVDAYISEGVVGVKVNTTQTLLILALGFAAGYLYHKSQQQKLIKKGQTSRLPFSFES